MHSIALDLLFHARTCSEPSTLLLLSEDIDEDPLFSTVLDFLQRKGFNIVVQNPNPIVELPFHPNNYVFDDISPKFWINLTITNVIWTTITNVFDYVFYSFFLKHLWKHYDLEIVEEYPICGIFAFCSELTKLKIVFYKKKILTISLARILISYVCYGLLSNIELHLWKINIANVILKKESYYFTIFLLKLD